MIGWAMAVVALFFGLGTGALLTVALGLAAGFQYVPDDAPIRRDPVIRVVAPAGTQITLDGDAVGKEITVAPGEQHTLEVTLRDHAPWTTELTLEKGDERVIIMNSATAKPSGR